MYKEILLTKQSLFVHNLQFFAINFGKNSKHLLSTGYLFNLYNNHLQGDAIVFSIQQIKRKLSSHSQEVARLGSESCFPTMTSDTSDDGTLFELLLSRFEVKCLSPYS